MVQLRTHSYYFYQHLSKNDLFWLSFIYISAWILATRMWCWEENILFTIKQFLKKVSKVYSRIKCFLGKPTTIPQWRIMSGLHFILSLPTEDLDYFIFEWVYIPSYNLGSIPKPPECTDKVREKKEAKINLIPDK